MYIVFGETKLFSLDFVSSLDEGKIWFAAIPKLAFNKEQAEKLKKRIEKELEYYKVHIREITLCS